MTHHGSTPPDASPIVGRIPRPIDTDAFSRSPARVPTQARRRLRLGITGVGASVLLSLALIVATATGLVPLAPTWRLVRGLDRTGAGAVLSAAMTAAVLALVVYAAHALLMAGIEHAGGRRAVRVAPTLVEWLRQWLRGVIVLGALLMVSIVAVTTAGLLAGTAAAAAVTFGLSVGLLLLQGPLARVTASLRIEAASAAVRAVATEVGLDPAGIRVVTTHDESFVGGWIGWYRHELWIPVWWTAAEHAALLRVQLLRRLAQRTSYARRRGWWRAALWPAVGLVLTAGAVPYDWSDARLWLMLPALGTLWSFVAVLLLPSASRGAVYFADAAAAQVVGVAATVAAIERLDDAQDGERDRPAVVETIFHPVPSVANRRARLALRRTPPLGGGHQQTRLTLFASLAAGSLLGRMVHCNIGRPALWVVYPGD